MLSCGDDRRLFGVRLAEFRSLPFGWEPSDWEPGVVRRPAGSLGNLGRFDCDGVDSPEPAEFELSKSGVVRFAPAKGSTFTSPLADSPDGRDGAASLGVRAGCEGVGLELLLLEVRGVPGPVWPPGRLGCAACFVLFGFELRWFELRWLELPGFELSELLLGAFFCDGRWPSMDFNFLNSSCSAAMRSASGGVAKDR